MARGNGANLLYAWNRVQGRVCRDCV